MGHADQCVLRGEGNHFFSRKTLITRTLHNKNNCCRRLARRLFQLSTHKYLTTRRVLRTKKVHIQTKITNFLQTPNPRIVQFLSVVIYFVYCFCKKSSESTGAQTLLPSLSWSSTWYGFPSSQILTTLPGVHLLFVLLKRVSNKNGPSICSNTRRGNHTAFLNCTLRFYTNSDATLIYRKCAQFENAVWLPLRVFEQLARYVLIILTVSLSVRSKKKSSRHEQLSGDDLL